MKEDKKVNFILETHGDQPASDEEVSENSIRKTHGEMPADNMVNEKIAHFEKLSKSNKNI